MNAWKFVYIRIYIYSIFLNLICLIDVIEVILGGSAQLVSGFLTIGSSSVLQGLGCGTYSKWPKWFMNTPRKFNIAPEK